MSDELLYRRALGLPIVALFVSWIAHYLIDSAQLSELNVPVIGAAWVLGVVGGCLTASIPRLYAKRKPQGGSARTLGAGVLGGGALIIGAAMPNQYWGIGLTALAIFGCVGWAVISIFELLRTRSDSQ